jgi:hypothetical protein
MDKLIGAIRMAELRHMLSPDAAVKAGQFIKQHLPGRTL